MTSKYDGIHSLKWRSNLPNQTGNHVMTACAPPEVNKHYFGRMGQKPSIFRLESLTEMHQTSWYLADLLNKLHATFDGQSGFWCNRDFILKNLERTYILILSDQDFVNHSECLGFCVVSDPSSGLIDLFQSFTPKCGYGTRMICMLKKKFPNVLFKVNAVPESIGFWNKFPEIQQIKNQRRVQSK